MVVNVAIELRRISNGVSKNNVDWEARQQQEKEKQERINILACQNSAIEILKNGLNVEDVKSVTLQLLENSDTLLYGDTSEEE